MRICAANEVHVYQPKHLGIITCLSWQALLLVFCCAADFGAMLASRSFQAGVKLLLATGSALLLTMLLMVYDTRVRRWGAARRLMAELRQTSL
jgi:hypothetical protein